MINSGGAYAQGHNHTGAEDLYRRQGGSQDRGYDLDSFLDAGGVGQRSLALQSGLTHARVGPSSLWELQF